MSEFDRVAYCEATADDTATAICASFDYTDAAVGEVSSGLDVFYLLFAGAMVFFMQSGFAMLCAGSIRQKASSGDVIPAHLPACQRELTNPNSECKKYYAQGKFSRRVATASLES